MNTHTEKLASLSVDLDIILIRSNAIDVKFFNINQTSILKFRASLLSYCFYSALLSWTESSLIKLRITQWLNKLSV